MSLGLARKKVTHVIIGRPCSSSSSSLSTPLSASSSSSSSSKLGGGINKGAGGGLAAGKTQKEIQRKVAGVGAVKYVGVEWVLECVRVGKRVSEAGFAGVRTAGAGIGGPGGLREMIERAGSKEEGKGGKMKGGEGKG